MKSFVPFVAAAVVISFCLTLVNAHKMKCDGHDMKKGTGKEILVKTIACLDKFVPEKEKLADDASAEDKNKAMVTRWAEASKNMCFQVCTLQAKSMFDDAGAYSQSGVDEMAKQFYPTTELADKMKEGLKKCAEGKTFSMDDNCVSYKPFQECMHKSHMDVCKVKVAGDPEM